MGRGHCGDQRGVACGSVASGQSKARFLASQCEFAAETGACQAQLGLVGGCNCVVGDGRVVAEELANVVYLEGVGHAFDGVVDLECHGKGYEKADTMDDGS